LSELICNFEFVGEFGLKCLGEDIQMIDSVVPGRCLIEPDFEEKKEYFSEIMPSVMGEDREVTDYSEVLFERNGEKIKAKARELWEVGNNERVVFL
jgi:CRISPR-associated protein Cas5h